MTGFLSSMMRKKPIEIVKRMAAESNMKRSLGKLDLISIGIGCTIGSGIFVLTGIVAREFTGPSVALSFAFAGFACSLTAFAYAEMASIVPTSGSAYSYAITTMGELFAWIVSANLLLQYLGGASTIAVGFTKYLKSLLRSIGDIELNEKFTTAPIGTKPGSTTIVMVEGAVINLPAIILTLLLTTILVAGVRESKIVNNIITIVKIVAILLFVFGGIKYIDTANYSPFIPPAKDGAFGVAGIFRGSQKLFMSYTGFDAVATAAQEAKNPEKDLPIGIIFSLLICTILYIAVALTMAGLTPYEQIEDSIPDMLIKFPGTKWLQITINLGACAGLTTACLISLMTQSRLFMVIADDGLLPSIFSRIHPKLQTPYWSSIICGIIVCVLSGFLPVSILGDMSSCGALIVFSFVNVAVMILGKTQPDLERGYRAPLGPFILPGLGAIITISLLAMSEMDTVFRVVGYILVMVIIYFIGPRNNSKIPQMIEENESMKTNLYDQV